MKLNSNKIVVYNTAYQVILGLTLMSFGFWFAFYVMSFTNLRNPNHYLLNYQVCWLQVVPWVYIVMGVVQLIAAVCGAIGCVTENASLLTVKIVLLVLLIVTDITLSALLFATVSSEHTKNFVKDTIYDGYSNIRYDADVAHLFGSVEKSLRCCGVNSARDYKTWREDLPFTCCMSKSADPSRVDNTCQFTDREANERYGCVHVVTIYTMIIGFTAASLSLVFAFLDFFSVLCACKLHTIYSNKLPRALYTMVNLNQVEDESQV